MSPQNMTPVISLDESGLNTLRRQAAVEAQPQQEAALPPPLPLDAAFASETPVSQAAVILDEGSGGSRNRGMFMVLALLLAAIGFIHFTGEHEDPLANIVSFFGDTFSFTSSESDISVAPLPEPEPAPPETAEVPIFDASMVPNPYWILPNQLEKLPKEQRPQEIVSPEDAEQYNNGLNHRYTYQRYRTAKEVRSVKRLGTTTFLARALNEPKLWTRMEGGLGLIELGYPLDVGGIERMLGDARPSLIYHYMQRFQKNPTKSQLYFMRQAIRLVDARTRLHILQILAKQQPRPDLYFAAAQYDPSPMVTDWLTEVYGESAVSQTVLSQYQELALNDYMQRGRSAPMRDDVSSSPQPVPAQPAITVRAEEIKVDEEIVEDVSVFTDEEIPVIQSPEEVFSEPEQVDDGFGDLLKLRN